MDIVTLTLAKQYADQVAGGGVQLVNGKIPAEQLPSYVDDVVEYEGITAFPEIGESGKIYVDTTDGATYRWSGSGYIEIGQKPLPLSIVDGQLCFTFEED